MLDVSIGRYVLFFACVYTHVHMPVDVSIGRRLSCTYRDVRCHGSDVGLPVLIKPLCAASAPLRKEHKLKALPREACRTGEEHSEVSKSFKFL